MSQARELANVAMQGEKTRGTGVVWCNTETDMKYVLIDEIEDDNVRESLRDSLSDDGDQYIFFVVKDTETAQLHVTKMEREVAMSLVFDAS